MKKKILCIALVALLSSAQVVSVFADRESDLRSARAAANSKLDAKNDQINTLEEKKQALLAEIDQLDAELVDIMVAIDVLTDEISQKQAEIEETKVKLAEAEEDRDKQYEDMKLRIQYIYENGGTDAWAQMLLSEEDLAALLNKAEYTQDLYQYDRESLEKFKAIVQTVKELGQQLATEKADLEAMQNEYKMQEDALEAALAEKKATSADYEYQIEVAKEQAAEYRALIQQQTAEIQAIEEEKRRAEEEAARRAAEEAAARQAAEEEEESDDYDSSESSSSAGNSYDDDSSDSGSSGGSSSSSGSSSSGSSSSGGGSYSSGSGSAVVNFATQFVGNPYVWGGTSLTNGADCSGFIQSVYANFGVSLPHSSAEMRYCGREVSYSEAQPGDIICYSGHVAIYMGGGSIVHASNAQDGIKISGNAAYRTILSVRRVL